MNHSSCVTTVNMLIHLSDSGTLLEFLIDGLQTFFKEKNFPTLDQSMAKTLNIYQICSINLTGSTWNFIDSLEPMEPLPVLSLQMMVKHQQAKGCKTQLGQKNSGNDKIQFFWWWLKSRWISFEVRNKANKEISYRVYQRIDLLNYKCRDGKKGKSLRPW